MASPVSRVRVYLACSLDGCVAGPDHDLSFLGDYGQPPAEVDADALTFDGLLADVGALLMGRQTYQVLLDHDVWPYGDRPVLVATHRELPEAPKGGKAWAVEGAIEDLVAEARDAAGDKDVYLDGGDLVRQGLDAGLVDELTLTFLPVVLGRGVRLWEGLQSRTELMFSTPTRMGDHMIQVRADVRHPSPD